MTISPGDITSVSDPLNHSTSFTYNTYGDVVATTDAVGNKTTFTYNSPTSIGWVMSSVSGQGNKTGGTPLNYTTTYVRNSYGEATVVRDPLWSSASPTAHETQTGYDADGEVTSTTDGNNHTTTYVYDAAGELVTTNQPNSVTTHTAYWPDGSVKSQTDGAGHITNYIYNALAQVECSRFRGHEVSSPGPECS